MIGFAADASSLVAYLPGDIGGDTHLIDRALDGGMFCLPPVVLTESVGGLAGNQPAFAKITAPSLLDVALVARDGDFRHFAKHCGHTLA